MQRGGGSSRSRATCRASPQPPFPPPAKVFPLCSVMEKDGSVQNFMRCGLSLARSVKRVDR
jgi:hypothetical protein